MLHDAAFANGEMFFQHTLPPLQLLLPLSHYLCLFPTPPQQFLPSSQAECCCALPSYCKHEMLTVITLQNEVPELKIVATDLHYPGVAAAVVEMRQKWSRRA